MPIAASVSRTHPFTHKYYRKKELLTWKSFSRNNPNAAEMTNQRRQATINRFKALRMAFEGKEDFTETYFRALAKRHEHTSRSSDASFDEESDGDAEAVEFGQFSITHTSTPGAVISLSLHGRNDDGEYADLRTLPPTTGLRRLLNDALLQPTLRAFSFVSGMPSPATDYHATYIEQQQYIQSSLNEWVEMYSTEDDAPTLIGLEELTAEAYEWNGPFFEEAMGPEPDWNLVKQLIEAVMAESST